MKNQYVKHENIYVGIIERIKIYLHKYNFADKSEKRLITYLHMVIWEYMFKQKIDDSKKRRGG